MCVRGIITGVCFLHNFNFYNPQKRTRFPSVLLGLRWKILRLLDLVLFLIVDVLFLSAVLALRPVVTLAGNKQSAGEQNTKD